MSCCCSTVAIALAIAAAIYFFIFRKKTKFNPSEIRGKRVLVTGASSGIGEQVAYKYAELGAKLVLSDRRVDLLVKVAEKCQQLGAQSVSTVAADQSVPADRQHLVDEVQRILGGLDHLLLIHGILSFNWVKNTDEYFRQFLQLFEVNYFSYVDLTRKFMAMLEESRGGVCVVSSITGVISGAGSTPYGSAKAALTSFYHSFRQEMKLRKTGVRVSVMTFGIINTERFAELAKEIKSNVNPAKIGGLPDVAAQLIVEGVSTGAYETVYPTNAKVAIFLHKLMPRIFEDFYAKRANTDASRHSEY